MGNPIVDRARARLALKERETRAYTVMQTDGEFSSFALSHVVRNFRMMLGKKYAVTVIRAGTPDGLVYGDVVDLKLRGRELVATVQFSRPQDAGRGFQGVYLDPDWQDPHTGKRHGPTLLAVGIR